jgi:hypothetical protein
MPGARSDGPDVGVTHWLPESSGVRLVPSSFMVSPR